MPDRNTTPVMSRRISLLWVLLLIACAAPPRLLPLPEEYADKATVLGRSDFRTWSDALPEYLHVWGEDDEQEILQQHWWGILSQAHHYLALSGGGENGAFTAGLLAGWTEAGDRPNFAIVTGISTGGLIAPFAFLGPKYDALIKEMYTGYTMDDLVEQRRVDQIVRGDAVKDSTPMLNMIKKHMTPEILGRIAYEYRKGRTLLIGTTHLDAARPVIWNIGRIANSGHSGALALIQKIMLASASIPVGTPPVVFDVEVSGQTYQELHVDGGVTKQVFLLPPGLDWAELKALYNMPTEPTVYVIRNGYLDPLWETTERKLLPIAGRTIKSLIRTQGIGDLYRIYLATLQDDMTFRLAYIPSSFGNSVEKRSGLEYMNALYEYAYAQARQGQAWHSAPPGVNAEKFRPTR